MEQIKKNIDNAFGWLSKIPVTGDAVDLMAAARQELRIAFQKLDEQEKKSDGGD